MKELILSTIKEGLGSTASLFKIEFDELLSEDEHVYSATFSFKPEPIGGTDFKTVGVKHSLEFGVDKDSAEVYLIYGEDDPVSVTTGNIYGLLYWQEATEAI